MNAQTAAKAILEKQITLDSVAQLRNVGVKLALIVYPMAVFIAFIVVSVPGRLFYISATDLAVSIAVLGSIHNFDFRPHKITATMIQVCKWCVLLFMFLKFRDSITKGCVSVLNWISHYGFERLPNVPARVWLLLILVVLFIPAGARLITLRDARSISSVIPFIGTRLKLEAASVAFFLICNTFGRRMKAAWQIASEKHVVVHAQGANKSRLSSFTWDFINSILQQALEVVLLTAQLVSERGFRRDVIAADRWGWAAYSIEDVLAAALLIGLVVAYAGCFI